MFTLLNSCITKLHSKSYLSLFLTCLGGVARTTCCPCFFILIKAEDIKAPQSLILISNINDTWTTRSVSHK